MKATYPHDLVQPHVGDIGVARQVNSDPVGHVKHAAAPGVLGLARLRVEGADGRVRDGGALHQSEFRVERPAICSK